ncbi:MAG: hypothetical protein WEA81_07370 [Dehalococcoidia bacterium]
MCGIRRSQGFGPHRIAWELGLHRSTVYAILRRSGPNQLDRMQYVTARCSVMSTRWRAACSTSM